MAGRLAALLNVVTHLPHQIWYEEDQHAQTSETLLLFDLGFVVNYPRFDQLTEPGVWFVTRTTKNIASKVERVLEATGERHDLLVWVGSGLDSRCEHLLRLVEVRYQGKWYRYLTNVVDPQRLPAVYVTALYWQRWKIEDAFTIAKRLLGLAYFWVGSVNGVMVQVWATWLLYAVVVDLTDMVAEQLEKAFGELSIEMVYRGLYHFTQASHRGDADDVVTYLGAKAQR